MDCGQNLSLPKDIAWERLAFSPDMFDTNFKDPGLPPKWRTSLAAFYYVVPEDETKDDYPDRKIMYIRVIASITGANFYIQGILVDDFVTHHVEQLEKDEVVDNFQKSIFETLATGRLAAYYPCLGAILQVAVFPHSSEADVSLWDYPYIQDFEPKKRELYETVSKSGEVLSGSSSALNLKKGTTTTESLEESDISSHSLETEVGAGLIPSLFATGKTKYGYKTEHATKKHTGKEESHLTSTDSSREKRETQSYTTSINQMYQPLLSYHLGTNRALWAISPRPNLVDSEFNLIFIPPSAKETTDAGVLIGRKLEGVQDFFLVVNMPKKSNGLCFQASLDTGYTVLNLHRKDLPLNCLVVMRRTIQSCGKFSAEGKFDVDYLEPAKIVKIKDFIDYPMVVYESENIPAWTTIDPKELNDSAKKTELVFKANKVFKMVTQQMLDGYSSRVYRPKSFLESNMFKIMVELSLEESTYKISELEFVATDKRLLEQLRERRVETVGDLMRAEYEGDQVVQAVLERILESTDKIGKKIANYQRVQYEKSQREKK